MVPPHSMKGCNVSLSFLQFTQQPWGAGRQMVIFF